MNSDRNPLWQKDDARPADWVTRFTVGEDYRWDRLLLPFDLRATRAHAWGLAHTDVLSGDELARINDALDALRGEAEAGRLTVEPVDEDCHTVIENALTDRLGDVGKKIHTGRSRNDQVLAALRLFLRERLSGIGSQIVALGERLCDLGAEYDDALMPGYTHLQRAMPSTAGLWAMGFAETLTADLDALRGARRRVNVSPLGSAAGYGVPHLNLPREAVADRLGFRDVQTHVTSVQLTRGKLEAGVVHALAQGAATINRMVADLVMFSMAEFDFVELPDKHCTGSSIMPQKKNPDVLELARAAHHQFTSDLQELTALPANLPSGYHRDLQHTKAAVMRSVLRAEDLLSATSNVLNGVRFRREAMEAACTPELFATARALKRVRRGVPFRDAYREAAAETDADAPDAEAALAAYEVAGYPGQTRPDAVRSELHQHEKWTIASTKETA
jgi:argininosuccinate lyase